jgi:MoxR-like ATPase
MNIRKFFACSVGKPGEDYVDDNLQRIVNNKAFILHENTIQKGLYDDIKNGDILILKYNNSFIAYGEAIENKKTQDVEWNLWSTVYEWFFLDDIDITKGISTYGIQENSLEGGGQMGTVKGLEMKFALEKMRQINPKTIFFTKILDEFNNQKNMEEIENIIKLLEYKYQIILQGPPGTGKTRMAKEIAKVITKPKSIEDEDILNNIKTGQLISTTSGKSKFIIISFTDNKLVYQRDSTKVMAELRFEDIKKAFLEKIWQNKNITNGSDTYSAAIAKYIYENYTSEKVKIIQFHPAYSYEDFVRGITAKSNGANIEYKTENKILVNLAKDAYANYLNSKKEEILITREKWVQIRLKEYFEDKQTILLQTSKAYLNNTTTYIKKLDWDNLNLTYYNDGYYQGFNCGFDLSFKKFYEVFLENYANNDHDYPYVNFKGEFRKLIVPLMNDFKTFLGEEPVFQTLEKRVSLNNYVLIIDEINRANLPAVIGELIYALEYRSETVNSMYDFEGDSKIILPPNLFIIGTMNTADRSVGHIDYAIRRRFAFVDILPTIEPIKPFAVPVFKKVSELFVKNFDANNWNEPKFEKSEHLASDFRPEDVWIGHSYFITKAEGEKGMAELELKLKYEVLPILKEYFKDGILIESESAKLIIDEISKDPRQ